MSAEAEHCGVALTLFACLQLPIRGVKAESLSHSLLNPVGAARLRDQGRTVQAWRPGLPGSVTSFLTRGAESFISEYLLIYNCRNVLQNTGNQSA